ncbi:hypothetical protein [Thermoplasma volcanium GSS1]|uniref:DUF5611 domain-containing protein n=1 Tax=Thermoplasma volcanium (strain ATCC 51530 / DSM 4299 / JCM 9571 / NBRC 15438 / GSS1) TaxID=273116 RepID=Q97CE3_THEVO|nr:DUF5611 family protein [Thermoplasma volcanium]BAB59301.1 hypothetical protein [Thermoplasma volcanium GSS1]
MRDYPVKKGIANTLESIADLLSGMGYQFSIEGDIIVTSLPGISRIEIKPEKRKLLVNTSDYSDGVDKLQIIKNYNDLIEKLTGYSAKERKKMMTKD